MGEEAGFGRTEKTSRMAVKGSEKVQSVLVAVVVEDRLCLSEVGVAGLHVAEVAGRTEMPAVTGLGQEAGGQNDLVEVEGLDRGLAREAEALVCQVEGVEVQKLLCSPPF